MSEERLRAVERVLFTHRLLHDTPEPWRLVHEGRLSADEAAVRLRGVEPDEVVERSKGLFGAPHTQDDRRRLDEVMRSYRSGATAPSRSGSTARWLVPAGLAAAAALLLWSLRPSPPEGPRPLGTDYGVTLERGLAEVRSSQRPDEIVTYRRDRSMEIWLRPHHAVDGPLEVSLHARRDGDVRTLNVDPVVDDKGTVSIVAELEQLGLTVGDWELVLAVGRPGHLPDGIDAHTMPIDEESYELHSAWIRITPAPRRREGER